MPKSHLGETGKIEYNTPHPIVDRARRVMGGIDLDPATNAEAQEYIQAAVHYTWRENGLTRQWAGRVFLNPPYARGVVELFIRKLTLEPEVEQSIVILNNATETQWARQLCMDQRTRLICFTTGRLGFLVDGKPKKDNVRGQMIVAFGDVDEAAFIREFDDVGWIARPIARHIDA